MAKIAGGWRSDRRSFLNELALYSPEKFQREAGRRAGVDSMCQVWPDSKQKKLCGPFSHRRKPARANRHTQSRGALHMTWHDTEALCEVWMYPPTLRQNSPARNC